MEKIGNVYEPYVDKNENGICASFGMELNLKDDTEIWKQLAEQGQLPAPVLDEQGFLDGFQCFAEAMDVRIYDYGAVEMDFFANASGNQIGVSNIQNSLSSETLQELHEAIREALAEHGYEEAKLIKNNNFSKEMVQMPEYSNEAEMLKAETEKTVVEIHLSDPDKPLEGKELLLKMEMDGNAMLTPDKYHEQTPNFLQNAETRKQLEEFVQDMQNSGKGEVELIAIERQMKGDEVLSAMSHPAISADAIAKELENTREKSELEVLKENTTKTVMTISEVITDDGGNFQYSEGKNSPDTEPPLLTVELDGYADSSADFFKNSDTRDKLSDAAEIISGYDMNDTFMKYEIQHFKDETPLDNPVGSVFKGDDIAKTLENIEPEKNANKDEYAR